MAIGFIGGYAVGGTNRFVGIAVFVIPVVAFVVWTVRRGQQGARLNNRAIALLAEGRLVDAVAAFTEAERLISRSPLPGYNIGCASIWLWRLDEARPRIEKATRGLAGGPIRIMAVPQLCFIAAVANDRARADALMKEVERFQLMKAPLVNVSRAVWAARSQRWAEVLNELEFGRVRALGGPARAFSDALRGWAMVQTGQPEPLLDAVGVFGETGPDALKKWWPEFAEYIAAPRGANAARVM
jgi:hypothetical protein